MVERVDAYNLSQGGAAFWIDIPIPDEDSLPLEEALVEELESGAKPTPEVATGGRRRRARPARRPSGPQARTAS